MKQTNSTVAGRLTARPTQPTRIGSPGLRPLELDGQRDGLLYVPATDRAEQPTPLILMLHGAGGDAENGLNLIQPWAEERSIIVLAIDSRDRTWDVIVSQYGPDITFINQALAKTFSQYAIDPNRIAIAGFSDGASYALSVGIMNGNLFTHIIAFSPGFIAPANQVGKPQCFVSHGQHDRVLSIDQCSRRIVPALQQARYEVTYREFNGAHTVPDTIVDEAMQWFADG